MDKACYVSLSVLDIIVLARAKKVGLFDLAWPKDVTYGF